ncbi:hypothetical protein FRC19_008957 [Serendipita sp. 401]|nr:hypothetical protein FRC19_008957 [Serendipita sp. 401]
MQGDNEAVAISVVIKVYSELVLARRIPELDNQQATGSSTGVVEYQESTKRTKEKGPQVE